MSGLYALGKQHLLQGDIAWLTADIKAVLLSSTYVVNLATHEFASSLSGVVATSANLGTKTSTGGRADCADITFTSVTGATCTQLVVYKDTGNAATSPLLAHIGSAVGLPAYPNGGDIVVVVDSTNGLFSI